ncbi:MAG: hypothetical protein LBI44_04730 [Oscillospiraceae bacterium]|jgi:hypothetical protein|nr:hypothetical protein [Oscillospiraceae bacterium]
MRDEEHGDAREREGANGAEEAREETREPPQPPQPPEPPSIPPYYLRQKYRESENAQTSEDDRGLKMVFHARRVGVGRSTMFMICALTLVNLAALINGTAISLPFSLAFAQTLALIPGGVTAGVALGLVVLLLLFWRWSRRSSRFTACFLALYALDTAYMVLILAFMVAANNPAVAVGQFAELLFHGWALGSLISALRSQRFLAKAKKEGN